MLPTRGWICPPTRRELTLVLFCLTVFVLSYNLETSLQLVGVNPSRLSSSYLPSIGIGTKEPGFDPDGRRPKEYRDNLEKLIVGDWKWEEGHVAGVEQAQSGIALPRAAIYNFGSDRASRSAAKEDHGIGIAHGVTATEGLEKWRNNVPVTSVVAHVPGYTVFENVVVANGTFFLIADDVRSLPPLHQISSSAVDTAEPPRTQDWQVLSEDEARIRLGWYGGRISGTTWISTDNSSLQDPYTLFSLYRTHNSLSITSRSSDIFLEGEATFGGNDVAAPLRIFFPYVPTFSTPSVKPPGTDDKAHPLPRLRSYTGINPLLQKAVLPTLNFMYSEDWQDLVDMAVPWLFENVVVADRGAAERGRQHWADRWAPPAKIGAGSELRRRADDDTGRPSWAAPFVGLKTPDGWWSPVRTSLLHYLRLGDAEASSAKQNKKPAKKGKGATKPVVTYVSMQLEPDGAGSRLFDADHQALVTGLGSLVREGVLGEAYVVHGNGSVNTAGWEWEDRMKAIARSSIVLGTYGPHLFDSVFMDHQSDHPLDFATSADGHPPHSASAPLLMEFFPQDVFVRDEEFAVRSLGLRYMAWWNDRKFTEDSLPPVKRATSEQRVAIDTKAVLQAIRAEVS